MAHRPNIFRELRNYHQEVSNRLTDKVYSNQFVLEKRRLDALDELIRFVRSLSYVKHKDTKARLEYYLMESGLNCRSTAEHLGIKNINRVEQTVKNASDKLRKIIGSPLKAVMQATDIETINEAIQKFRESPTQPGTYGYFLPGISRFLPNPKYQPNIKLEECKRELSRVGVYAHFAEYVLTEDCDQIKLAHILSLLSSRNGSRADREALKKFFSGDFSVSVTGEQYSIVEQVNQMLDWLDQQNPYKSLKEADDDETDGY